MNELPNYRNELESSARIRFWYSHFCFPQLPVSKPISNLNMEEILTILMYIMVNHGALRVRLNIQNEEPRKFKSKIVIPKQTLFKSNFPHRIHLESVTDPHKKNILLHEFILRIFIGNKLTFETNLVIWIEKNIGKSIYPKNPIPKQILENLRMLYYYAFLPVKSNKICEVMYATREIMKRMIELDLKNQIDIKFLQYFLGGFEIKYNQIDLFMKSEPGYVSHLIHPLEYYRE